MTKDEALKQALGYVERNCPALVFGEIKEALAQPVQEPVAWYHNDFGVVELSRIPRSGWKPLYTTPPQLEERNFCPRCGKRTADLTTIHACTPPQENT